MTDSVVVRVEHVSHHYGKTVALDDVSIELPAGRMIGVLALTRGVHSTIGFIEAR